MRGDDQVCGSFFSYIDLEARIGVEHPLRAIREIVNTALAALSRDFEALYSGLGRPSIPPEKLLRAMRLEAFYSVRSERQFMERIEFGLLARWFVGLGIDDPMWDHSSFSANRDRLLDAEIAVKFLAAVLSQPRDPAGSAKCPPKSESGIDQRATGDIAVLGGGGDDRTASGVPRAAHSGFG
jgi:transposase